MINPQLGSLCHSHCLQGALADWPWCPLWNLFPGNGRPGRVWHLWTFFLPSAPSAGCSGARHKGLWEYWLPWCVFFGGEWSDVLVAERAHGNHPATTSCVGPPWRAPTCDSDPDLWQRTSTSRKGGPGMGKLTLHKMSPCGHWGPLGCRLFLCVFDLPEEPRGLGVSFG